MLIADEAFEEAIEFLEGAIRQRDDAALHLLLDQASSGREQLRQKIDAAPASAEKLAQAGKLEKVLCFFDAQPPAIQRSFRVQISRSALEED